MPLHSLVLFLVAALALTLTPGPDILTVIARSLAQGTWAGIVATLGFATGLIFHTSAAALGLSLILRQSPAALRTIQFLGAAYLVYLALRMFLGRDSLVGQPRPDQVRTLWRIYGQSILMNVLNPKVTLFFLAFLTGFADPTARFPVPLQMVIYGALFAACTLLGFGICAFAAGQLSRFFTHHPRAHKPLRLATAVLFLLIALAIITTHVTR